MYINLPTTCLACAGGKTLRVHRPVEGKMVCSEEPCPICKGGGTWEPEPGQTNSDNKEQNDE